MAKRIVEKLILVFGVFCLSACNVEVMEDWPGDDYEGYAQEIPAEDLTVFEVESTHGFAAILNAYAEFERSGFVAFYEGLVSPSYFVWRHHSIAIQVEEGLDGPHFMYAFHDMNGDGVPELFIGGVWGQRRVLQPALYAVYALQNGVPVPLIYNYSPQEWIGLFRTITGEYTISLNRSRMDIIRNTFFGFDEKGNFVVLEGVFSWERNSVCRCCYTEEIFFTEFSLFFSQDRPFSGIEISEDEYIGIVYWYGVLDDMGRVELAWERVVQ